MHPIRQAAIVVVARRRTTTEEVMQRYVVIIEGANLEEIEETELLALPNEGDPIETKFGTCLVVKTEATNGGVYSGRIVCRLPGY
jgi:hypothetical protein